MARLTRHQKKAYKAVYARLTDAVPFTTLQGFAGTGKTFLVGQLIDQLARERYKVHVCAPTHKAAQVLNSKIQRGGIQAQTIHSFLGLRLVPDQQGGYKLIHEEGHQRPSDAIVIVDEASMVGQDEWAHIQQATDLHWLFVGDPAQLPPVNEGASPVFDLEGPVLEDVVRQARDNPILQLATCVRNGEPFPLEKQYAKGKGVGVTRRKGAFLDSVLRAVNSKDFTKNGTHARVLAYRNRTVAWYNQQIRAALHPGDAPRFVAGEWLVSKDTWYHQGVPYLINSEEVRILKAFEDSYDTFDAGVWDVWVLEVKAAEDVYARYLYVLHEKEARRYKDKLDTLRQAALKDRDRWKNFYQLKEAFASVDYAYASTIHKAQGSTFHTAFVDYRDTMSCRGREKQALLYVAVTRPSQRLALYV